MKFNKLLLTFSTGFILTVGCGNADPDYSEFYRDPNAGNEQPGPDLPENPNDKAFTVKVMSFNIRYYTDKDQNESSWDFRKKAFGPMIDEMRPTVIGVQEARPPHLTDLKTIWPDYAWIGVGRRSNGAQTDEFVPIFYDTKAVELVSGGVKNKDWGCFWLSDTPDVVSWYEGSGNPRIATWAFFRDKATGGVFFFVNTHIDVNGTDDQIPVKQMVVLKAQMERINTAKLPTMLTADFNKTLDNPIYIFGPVESMINVRVYLNGIDDGKNSDNTPTYQAFGNHATGLIVDHIFCSDFIPSKYQVVTKSYEGVQYISDHYPIQGTLTYKTGK